MARLLLTASSILPLAACSGAAGPPETPAPEAASQPAAPSPAAAAAAAYEQLLTVDLFGTEAVGYAGLPSPGAQAFAVLYRAPDAAARFASLLQRAAPPGQLYALCGLRFLRPEQFDRAAAPYRARTDPVTEMRGCSRFTTELGRLVDQIENGVFDSLRTFAESDRPR